ncbi:hypothetical protein [Sessilibacter corallicola]|nr:hypothetical protein [Sessilibacter corallicola]MCE2027292.1 hypothetical protein [Sessilibacter corallicola]
MFSWIFIVFALWASWFLTDIHSESTMENTIFPLLMLVFAINLLLKCIYFFGFSRSDTTADGYNDGNEVLSGYSERDNVNRDGD